MVAESIRDIDDEILKLSSLMLDVDIRKSSKLYKRYEDLAKISSKLRSDLEEEFLRKYSDLPNEELLGVFYGKKL